MFPTYESDPFPLGSIALVERTQLALPPAWTDELVVVRRTISLTHFRCQFFGPILTENNDRPFIVHPIGNRDAYVVLQDISEQKIQEMAIEKISLRMLTTCLYPTIVASLRHQDSTLKALDGLVTLSYYRGETVQQLIKFGSTLCNSILESSTSLMFYKHSYQREAGALLSDPSFDNEVYLERRRKQNANI